MTVWDVCVDSQVSLQSCLSKWASRCFDNYLLQRNSPLITYCLALNPTELLGQQSILSSGEGDADMAEYFPTEYLVSLGPFRLPVFSFHCCGVQCSVMSNFLRSQGR